MSVRNTPPIRLPNIPSEYRLTTDPTNRKIEVHSVKLLGDTVDELKASSAPPTPPKAPPQAKAEAKAHPVWSLLSSHPDTAERARALRAGQAPGCS